MNKENIRRRIRNVTAFAAALLLAAAFTFPAGTEIMGESFGNAIVASAEEYYDQYQLYYEVNSDGNTVTITRNGVGDSYVIIPNEIDGKTVTAIGDFAFSDCTSLTSITIPDSVTSIGDFAFSGCTSITSITIPDSVTSIGDCAFSSCTSLTSVSFADNSQLTSIGINAFENCTNLKNITIPKSVNSIGEYAFCSCTSLAGINVPSSVTSIGPAAFGSCTSLISIDVDEDNAAFCSIDGVFFNKEKTSLLKYPSNKSGVSYTIPDSVISIDYGAFSDCAYLESIIIPKSVKSIRVHAFSNSGKLESVTFEENSELTYIPEYAFDRCSSLKSINIPGSVASIGKLAFRRTGLTSITIPASVTSIGESAFYDCRSLTSIFLPNTVDVSNADIPSAAAQIKYTVSEDGRIAIKSVENGSAMTSVVIPEAIGGKEVASIGNSAFNSCSSLTSIFLPQDVDISESGISETAAKIRYSIGEDDSITITKVVLGSNEEAFVLPDNIGGKAVTFLADGALADCPNVKHTHRDKTAATCIAKAFCVICEKEYGEIGTHSLKKHDAVPATCTTDGNREYYECNVCDKLFTDESGTTETTPEAVMISAIGHSISHVYAKDPTCTEDGNNEHYKCSVCNMLFEDANGTMETTLDDVTIPAIGHNFGIACDSNAGGHYYVCTVCDEKSDIEEHIKGNGTVIKEATPTENGTITYKCIVCGAKAGEETITATISSFEVTASNVIVYYTVPGSTEEKSQKYDFDEVTEEWIEIMKSKDIQLVIDFVNYSTAGSDTILLTDAQMKAIEYVLAHDYGIAS